MKFALAWPCKITCFMLRRIVKSFLLMINLIGIVIGASIIVWVIVIETARLNLNLPFSFGFVDYLLKNLAIMGFFILALTFLGCVGVILEGFYGKWLSIIHTILLSVIVAIQIYVLVILLLLSAERGFIGTIGDGLRLSREGLQIAKTGFNTIGIKPFSNSSVSKPSADSMALDEELFKNNSPTYGDKQNSDESQQQPLFLSRKTKRQLPIFGDIPIVSSNLRNVDALSKKVLARVVGSTANDVIGAVRNYEPAKQMKEINGVLNKALSKMGDVVDKAGYTLKATKRTLNKNVEFAKEQVSSASETVSHNKNEAIDIIRSIFEKVDPVGKIVSIVQTVSETVENNIGHYNKHIVLLKPILGVLTKPVVFASRSLIVMECFVIFNVIEVLYIILITVYLYTMELQSEEDKQEQDGSVS